MPTEAHVLKKTSHHQRRSKSRTQAWKLAAHLPRRKVAPQCLLDTLLLLDCGCDLLLQRLHAPRICVHGSDGVFDRFLRPLMLCCKRSPTSLLYCRKRLLLSFLARFCSVVGCTVWERRHARSHACLLTFCGLQTSNKTRMLVERPEITSTHGVQRWH